MARNRQNLNIIYISDRMRETLRPIASCALTAVVAPMGYGKTTAVRWFLAEQAKAGAVVLQASIYSDNRSIFWKSVQKAFAAAGLTVLEGYDCPADASGAALLLEDLCAALGGKTPYYLFLDDFHLLGDERVAQFLCRLAYRLPENVHLIVASRNRFLPGEQVVRLGRRLHHIEADGLRLNREELLAYTHRCGVEITAAQAESLLRSCEGWFSAVYLNLHALAERGSLLQPGPDIYAMFTAAMLESLPEKTRGFLAVMGLADEFTVEMARAVTALPDAEEVLRALTQQNAFVTRLPDGVSFRFHHMMKECAERLFAQLPAARQTEVWQRYGRWYAQKAQYLHALQAFEHCGDRDAALAVIEADPWKLLASLSPAGLLRSDESYYLVALADGEKRHYRVDRMAQTQLSGQPRQPGCEQLNLAALSRRHFGMFSGEERQVKLRCPNRLAHVMLDRFGLEVMLVPDGEDHFTLTADVAVSQQFFCWLFGLGGEVEVLAPREVRQALADQLSRALEQYRI